MKWTAYSDVSVLLLTIVLLYTGSTKSQRIVFGEGVLIEHISSQTFTPVKDVPENEFYKERNLELLDMRNQTVTSNENCPFLRCMMEPGNYESGEQAGSILIFVEY
jgi:hypothetical protein